MKWFEDHILQELEEIEFLSPEKKSFDKGLSVVFELQGNIFISPDCANLVEGLDFLRSSFAYFHEKHRNEYQFHRPEITCDAGLFLKLLLTLRKKDEPT